MAAANSTADRAIEILLLFSESNPVLSANEIAARFKMPRSTTYRYLRSLKDQGLVEELASGGYRLGYRILDLARTAQRSFDILEVAEPHLRALARDTGESVLLSYLSGTRITVLECIESAHPMRIAYDRGQLLPTPAAATAKAFLAFAKSLNPKDVLKGVELRRYTPHTVTSTQRVLKEVEETRKRGFAINEGEVDEGINAVAAPIPNDIGPVVHCISVVAPALRLPRAKLLGLGPVLKVTASDISKAAGLTGRRQQA
ncbi:MAG: IclR family transcriptional regulator [Steroidobacteraceae bacterium]